MQIRRAQPDAVEKSRGIAAGLVFHQPTPFDAEVPHDFVRLDGGFLAPGFEPLVIRPYFFDRYACTGAFARVAPCAIRVEDPLTGLSQFFIYRKWKLGRLFFAQ